MAWLARLGDLWAGHKARAGLREGDPAAWDDGQTDDEGRRYDFASSDLDIDLTAPQALDLLSSSFDLMQGLTVTEIPLEAVPVDLRTALRPRR